MERDEMIVLEKASCKTQSYKKAQPDNQRFVKKLLLGKSYVKLYNVFGKKSRIVAIWWVFFMCVKI